MGFGRSKRFPKFGCPTKLFFVIFLNIEIMINVTTALTLDTSNIYGTCSCNLVSAEPDQRSLDLMDRILDLNKPQSGWTISILIESNKAKVALAQPYQLMEKCSINILLTITGKAPRSLFEIYGGRIHRSENIVLLLLMPTRTPEVAQFYHARLLASRRRGNLVPTDTFLIQMSWDNRTVGHVVFHCYNCHMQYK